MTYYKIKGLGRGLDGLIVDGQWTEVGWFSVSRIINENVMFGDREVTVLLTEDNLRIHSECLEEYKDYERREFDHSNPFGEHLSSKLLQDDDLRIAVSRYTNVTSITVMANDVPSRTYWAGHFAPDFDIDSLVLKHQGDLAEVYMALKNWAQQE